MHIKAIVKTIFNYLQPDWYQTYDNNYDPANQFENSVITEQLRAYVNNMEATMQLLRDYCYFNAVANEGLILTKRDIQTRAESFYNNLLDCNFIRNGILVPGVLKEITSVIER